MVFLMHRRDCCVFGTSVQALNNKSNCLVISGYEKLDCVQVQFYYIFNEFHESTLKLKLQLHFLELSSYDSLLGSGTFKLVELCT